MGSEVVDQLVQDPGRGRARLSQHHAPEFFQRINPHAAFARLGLRQLSRIAPGVRAGIGVSNSTGGRSRGGLRGDCARRPSRLGHSRCRERRVLARWKGMRTRSSRGRISQQATRRPRADARVTTGRMRSIPRAAPLAGVSRSASVSTRAGRAHRAARLAARSLRGSVDDAFVVAYYRAATRSSRSPSTRGSACRSSRRCTSPSGPRLDAAAIGETVGDAGVLLRERDLARPRARVGRREDRASRRVWRRRERVQDFDPERSPSVCGRCWA